MKSPAHFMHSYTEGISRQIFRAKNSKRHTFCFFNKDNLSIIWLISCGSITKATPYVLTLYQFPFHKHTSHYIIFSSLDRKPQLDPCMNELMNEWYRYTIGRCTHVMLCFSAEFRSRNGFMCVLYFHTLSKTECRLIAPYSL